MSSNRDLLGTALSPTELCFDKNDFMKTTFSVDEFLHKNRNAASLELLRDNLGIYLKVLRGALIDLINEDYADFVSLSANLVGLDESIDVIQRPLELFRDDISSIRSMINESEAEIRDYLQQKSQLRVFKRNLQSLKRVYLSTQKLEDLLAGKLSSDNSIKSSDLERAALELVQLKFHMKFCEEFLIDTQKEQIERLNLDVLKKLRVLFHTVLKSSSTTVSTENLERCLRIYITLDACHIAEDVFREDIVGPYMQNVISEHVLQNSPQGLAGIYTRVLNFIAEHMSAVLRITHYTEKLKGFNFIVNSFWKEVESRLETHMSSIYAPGNSDVFFAKYKCTREFLAKIEETLGNETMVKHFRCHPQTRAFQSRWNLPVYFQICFQEIAGAFESVLEPILSDEKYIAENDSSDYKFTPFLVARKSIEKCWSDGVYLYEVFPKFWKFTVQIVQRLIKWISSVLDGVKKNNFNLKLTKTNILVLLYGDIVRFIQKLPEILELVVKNTPQALLEGSSMLEGSLEDMNTELGSQLKAIEDDVTEMLIAESGENIRQVSDIPRLYRKTNREIPSRNSTYLEQMLKPIRVFEESFREKVPAEVLRRVLLKVFEAITEQYYTIVIDVLTSVQKTEESLRRLRNLKSNVNQSSSANNESGATSSTGMSDDDKIRLQLRVDVIGWTNEITKFSIQPWDVGKLLELNNFVEETLNNRESS